MVRLSGGAWRLGDASFYSLMRGRGIRTYTEVICRRSGCGGQPDEWATDRGLSRPPHRWGSLSIDIRPVIGVSGDGAAL